MTALAASLVLAGVLCAGDASAFWLVPELEELRALSFQPTLPPIPKVGEFYVEESTMDSSEGPSQLRVWTISPPGAPVADILFLHGFGDRIDNHGPLFEAWVKAGLRVVTFDFPGHGMSSSGFHLSPPVDSLMNMAVAVEKWTRTDSERPLLLAGWSLGGLTAARLAQTCGMPGAACGLRPLKGLILFAPAVAPRAFVGEGGKVTNRTLTRNPLLQHRWISPNRPMLLPGLALSLLGQAKRSHRPLPAGLATLVLVAGHDAYAKSDQVRDWVLARRSEGSPPRGMFCPEAFHELDNEPEPEGQEARGATTRFAIAALTAGSAGADLALAACREF